MLDNDPVARCCAAYGYWQATASKSAVSVLENGTTSDDEDERTVAAHGLAKIDIRKVRHLQGTEADDKPNTPPQPIRPSMLMVVEDEQRVGPRFAVDEDADDTRSSGDDCLARVEEHRL